MIDTSYKEVYLQTQESEKIGRIVSKTKTEFENRLHFFEMIKKELENEKKD